VKRELEENGKADERKPTLPVGVSVLLVRDGKLLLGERCNVSAAGMYSTPGGRIEQSEDMLQCAIRETYEETGLALCRASLTILGAREHFRFGQHYIMFYVRCRAFDGEPLNREPEKCVEWRWFARAEIPQNCTEPSDIIDAALAATRPCPKCAEVEVHPRTCARWSDPASILGLVYDPNGICTCGTHVAPDKAEVVNILPEELAQQFHRWYEILAPQFGYDTRKESAVPWEQVPEKNRDLMISVALHVIEGMNLCRIK